MDGGLSCCKYLMFFFNLLIFLSGTALLAVGIWVLVGADSFKQVISDDVSIFSAVYIIIAVGVLLFLVGFLGCCGAIKENRFCLGAFFLMVLLIFIIEIVGAVLAFVYYPDARQVAVDSMQLYGQTTPEGQSATTAWNAFQEGFECCGINGPTDWVTMGITSPPTCAANLLLPGCESQIKHYFWVLGGISIGVLVVELLAMIFACCLYTNVGKDRYA